MRDRWPVAALLGIGVVAWGAVIWYLLSPVPAAPAPTIQCPAPVRGEHLVITWRGDLLECVYYSGPNGWKHTHPQRGA